jgi:zinc protease
VKLTAPRRDQKAFESWKAAQVEARRNLEASPEIAFDDRFAVEASGNHLRRRRPTPADYEKISLDRALRFYKKRTANLSGATMVVVGAFDVEKVRPLVLAYLGGLPGKGKPPRWRDVRVKPPRGKVRFEVKQGLEAKAGVRLMFHGKTPWSREAEHDLESLAQALRIRLREELREEMGGVYGVAVNAELRRDPVAEYELTIAFGCAPENADKLVARAREEIEAFRRSGPAQTVVDKVVAAQRRERETAIKDNDFWLEALAGAYRLRLDPRVILEEERLIARVSAKTLQASAQRTFGSDEVLGVLLPK